MAEDVIRPFGYIDKTFINVYDQENPILNVGDECYFMVNSSDNCHRPVLAKGLIIKDFFSDGMHKIYYIRLLQFEEDQHGLDNFVYKGQWYMIPYSPLTDIGTKGRNFNIGPLSPIKFFENHVFKSDSFFVRQKLEDLRILRKEYIKIIYDDMKLALIEIEDLLKD